LPPWIREGLEKMEREKQKKEEREKADLEREEATRRRLKEEQEALCELDSEKSGIPRRSKFVINCLFGLKLFSYFIFLQRNRTLRQKVMRRRRM